MIMMIDKPLIRFGIIGCSSVAKRRFLPALLKSPLAKIEHIGSRSFAKASEYATMFSCSKAGYYKDVIEDPNVDAIYISIPVTLREYWLKEAIKNKKHILSEKPAFCNLDTSIDILQLCEDSKLRIMENYMFQYHPQHILVNKLIEENKIGIPKIFTGEYSVPRPNSNNIRFKTELGGGIFLDAAGYLPMAAKLQLKSSPVSVFCQKQIDTTTGVDDVVVMLVNFSGGEFAHFTSSYGLQHRSRYALHGTLGRIEVKRAFAVNPDIKTIVSLETDEGVQKFSVEPADQFLLMINDFITQINSGPFKNLENSILNQHIFMEAARKSIIENRSVELSEFFL